MSTSFRLPRVSSSIKLGRSTSTSLVSNSISSECNNLAKYERLSQSMRLADEVEYPLRKAATDKESLIKEPLSPEKFKKKKSWWFFSRKRRKSSKHDAKEENHGGDSDGSSLWGGGSSKGVKHKKDKEEEEKHHKRDNKKEEKHHKKEKKEIKVKIKEEEKHHKKEKKEIKEKIKEEEKKKDFKSSWMPDPEERWPIQGW